MTHRQGQQERGTRSGIQRVLRPSILLLTTVVALGCGDNQTTSRDRIAYEAPPAEPLACVPNLDGRIDASELQAGLGIPVSYLVSPAGTSREVALAGEATPEGTRWDLGIDYADDRVARLAASPLAGRWYEGSFPAGEFVAALDAGGTLEAVYSHTEEALLLHGIASSEEAPTQGKTLLPYQVPVVANPFPLEPGITWTSTGKVVGGTVRGLPYAGVDTYEGKVDGIGRLDLPDLAFEQVLRVRTRVTLEPSAGKTVVTRQTAFFFECFGEVARATSQADEEARPARPTRKQRTSRWPPSCGASDCENPRRAPRRRKERRKCCSGTCGRRVSTPGRTPPRSTWRR
jgi:hypothetical protein